MPLTSVNGLSTAPIAARHSENVAENRDHVPSPAPECSDRPGERLRIDRYPTRNQDRPSTKPAWNPETSQTGGSTR